MPNSSTTRDALLDASKTIIENHSVSMMPNIIPVSDLPNNYLPRAKNGTLYPTKEELETVGKGSVNRGLAKFGAYNDLGQQIMTTRARIEASLPKNSSLEQQWAASYQLTQKGFAACKESCVRFMIHFRANYPDAEVHSLRIQNCADPLDSHILLLIVDGSPNIDFEALINRHYKKPMYELVKELLDKNVIIVDPWIKFAGNPQDYALSHLLSLFKIGYQTCAQTVPTVTAEAAQAIRQAEAHANTRTSTSISMFTPSKKEVRTALENLTGSNEWSINVSKNKVGLGGLTEAKAAEIKTAITNLDTNIRVGIINDPKSDMKMVVWDKIDFSLLLGQQAAPSNHQAAAAEEPSYT